MNHPFIGEVFTPAPEGVLDAVLAELSGHKVLGVRKVERMLPVGAVVTAVGELAPVIDHPGAFKVKGAELQEGGWAGVQLAWPRMHPQPEHAVRIPPPPPSTPLQHAVRSGGRMYVLRQPQDGGPFLLSRRPLPDLVASLEASALGLRRWGTVFTAVGAGMLAASLVHHALTWQRQQKLRERLDRARRERLEGGAGVPGGDSGRAAAW